MNAQGQLRFLWALGAVLIAVSCVDEHSPALLLESPSKGVEAHTSGTEVPRALRAAYVAAIQKRAPEGYLLMPTI